MDKPGQSYAPVVDNPPEPPILRREDDELAEIQFDRVVSGKVRLLWMRRDLLWKFAMWGFIISFIVAFLLPLKYESTVRLMPPESQSNSGLAGILAMATGGGGSGKTTEGLGGIAANLLGMRTSGELFMGILQGPTVQDRLIDDFDLRKEYGYKRYMDAEKELAKNTEVAENRKNGIITLTVTASSPVMAQAMATAYIQALRQQVNQVSTSSARRERVFLEGRLKVVKKELDEASQQFSVFASKNQAINIPEQAKATMIAAARLEGELVAANSELEGLQQVYTDNNVRVRSLRARVAELKKQLDSTGKGGDTPDSLAHMIREMPKLGVTWAELYRRTMIAEAVFEALTKQYEYAKVQEAKEIPPVSVLDAANLPEKKSSPKRAFVILGGLIFSLVLGAGWIVGKESWQAMNPADDRKQFALEVWGTAASRVRVWTRGITRRARQNSE